MKAREQPVIAVLKEIGLARRVEENLSLGFRVWGLVVYLHGDVG